jgi:integrase
MTGMRQGELLGLRWEDVNLETGIIYVRQQLQYLPEKGFFFKEPKQSSKRAIPMPLPLNALLRQVKKEQERIKNIYEESGRTDYNSNDLVFCTPEGKPMDGSALTKRFQALLIKNGFSKIRFHSLRHTFATMCRAAGTNLEDVQDLLGHADISTTKNMYTHIEIEPLRKAMDKFTQYFSS